ncbi:hypothetical protein PVW51_21100 [Sulfitobacter sp. PR48]|uniref:hypothetical protein n=1 Tax=unclassified Sulfitobacter TaxID=196795 RepID=UPI0022AEE826|nr:MULTISPECIES: hypothetical protein [unclassified Sulfitobacter]MCZ4257915.1 hypothetical protein [Sulfitobacter sp. G21635-S1]MDD9723209.1 hypothetical protein [Sulfitobacter sp. PR48]
MPIKIFVPQSVSCLGAFLGLAFMACPASADQVIADDLIVQRNLCVGAVSCVDGEVFNNEDIKIKSTQPEILFDDTSVSGGFADWSLQTNVDGSNNFVVRDQTNNTTPFRIEANTHPNSLYVSSVGGEPRIGFGTALPQQELHIFSQNTAIQRFEQGSVILAPRVWDLGGNETSFFLSDTTGGTIPFHVRAGAPVSSLVVDRDGNIGLGTGSPEERLHIRSNAINTDAFALFDANGAGSDAAFRLRQNGVTPTTWEFRNQQDSGRLNVGIAGGNTPLKIDSAANNNLLRLGRNGLPGEVNITGTLVVNNTQLNVPDYVFDADYPLRPLAEVQAFIDANSHLPDVPSAAEIAATGVDMTQMQMLHLKKIEELTLYTLEQEDRISTQDARIAMQEDRIARLEAALEALAAQ